MLIYQLVRQLFVGFLFGVLVVNSAQAATWRYSLGFPSGVPIQTAKTYAEAIKKYTDERYSIRIYEMSLLNLSEMSEGINKGLTDVGYLLTAYSPSEYPFANMASDMSMSTMLDERAQGKEAYIYTGAMLEYVMLECAECQEELSKNNQVYTSLVLTLPYSLMCNSSVTTPESMQGKRIRMSGASWARWVRELGAQPVSMPAGEMYEALSQGVVDCTLVSPTELTNFNLLEVVRHITPNVPGGLFATGAATTINKKRWQQLNNDDKLNFLKAGALVSAVGTVGYMDQGQDDMRKAKEKGITITEASPELIKKTQDFIKKDIEFIPQFYASEYKLDESRSNELSKKMLSLIDKWSDIFSSQDKWNNDQLYQIYWDNIYSKINIDEYGK